MKKIFTEDGLIFDSREELLFYRWCKEAKNGGYINDFCYHPNPFELSNRVTIRTQRQMKTRIKTVDRFLLHPHEYTPDFVIEPTSKLDEFKHGLVTLENCFYIDIKGGFSLYNNHREFSINQKWVYEKYGIYINKVEPKKFFKKTWTPGSVRKASTLKNILAECLNV